MLQDNYSAITPNSLSMTDAYTRMPTTVFLTAAHGLTLLMDMYAETACEFEILNTRD